MNKISYKTIVLISALLFIVIGCTKDFEDMNVNPNQPAVVPTSYLLTNAQFNIMDGIWDEWWNGRQGLLYSQYWSQTAYSDESRFLPRTSITNTYWNLFYLNMMDLQNIIDLNTNDDTKGPSAAYGPNANQIAVAMIIKAYTFHMMTDIWGDIPFSESLAALDGMSPKYDKQQDIYAQLQIDLKAAQGMIVDGDIEGDMIYGGDMTKWKKFANSLRMRIALRSSKANANYMAQIQEAISDGVFESHDDDAYFQFSGAVQASNNPLYLAFFVDNRTDFAVSEPLINTLKDLNDPRLSIYADPSVSSGEFAGLQYGLDNANTAAAAGPSGDDVSLPSAAVVLAADANAYMMTYGEVCFIKSEINGWDQTEYENGISASMKTWGVADDDITAYIAAVPAASAENVATQKWLGLYMQGNQGWFEVRRTGFPVLAAPADGALEDIGSRNFPSRLFYPNREQIVNGAQYDAAVGQQGADLLSTKVWWDK